MPARKSDFRVGQQLLHDYIFIHLDHPADKLALLLQVSSIHCVTQNLLSLDVSIN